MDRHPLIAAAVLAATVPAAGASAATLVDAQPAGTIPDVLAPQVLFDATPEAGEHDPIVTAVDRVPLTRSSPVAEPANWAMLGAGFGLIGLGLQRRRARPRRSTQAV